MAEPVETKKAVFLSYSSQDAPAAKRICEALRAAAIEVWFDQSELRGGDAWDQKIRQQIRECALFIPVISASTAGRHEGYFRLEWNLADDRTQKIARNRPFIFPVCLDGTPEGGADVPDSFVRVQWTKLPGGVATDAFVARIAEVLSARETLTAAPTPLPASAPSAAPAQRKNAGLALLAAAVLVLVIGYLVLSKFSTSHHGAAAILPAAPSPDATPGAVAKSIAVLPFADLSEKKDQAYFSDGLAEELLNLLAKTPGLHVIARTSSFSFKDKSDDIPTIGQKLHVANILEGSVRKSGNRLRVTTQLIRVQSGEQVWSESYDRELKDVFLVQDEIAGAVVSSLKVSLLGNAPSKAIPTANTEAYTAYLKCTEAFRIQTRESQSAALEYCQNAIDLDANFAPAWATLSDVTRSLHAGFGIGSYEDVRAKAFTALQRSLMLDPKNAKAHLVLALIFLQMDFDPAAAAEEMQRSVALEPLDARGYWMRGYIADVQGHYDESLQNLLHARDLNPLSTEDLIQIGNTHYRAGNLTEAAAAFQSALVLSPTIGSVHYRLALLKLAAKDPAGALVEMQLEPDAVFHALGIPMALDALGRKGEADAALASAEKNAPSGAAYQVALMHASRHDSDATFLWLDRAYQGRDAGMLWMKFDPLLKEFRSDPRFQALVQKMHFG